MGDPKLPSKKTSSPRNPWAADLLTQELVLVGTYGLRNKKELRRASTNLSRIRKQARQLLAAPVDVRSSEEPKLLKSLIRRGFVPEAATLDEVLALSVESVLDRRLQTVVWKKGYAVTPHQARQRINHGHIQIGSRRVTVPGYIVRTEEDDRIRTTLAVPERTPPQGKVSQSESSVTTSGSPTALPHESVKEKA